MELVIRPAGRQRAVMQRRVEQGHTGERCIERRPVVQQRIVRQRVVTYSIVTYTVVTYAIMTCAVMTCTVVWWGVVARSLVPHARVVRVGPLALARHGMLPSAADADPASAGPSAGATGLRDPPGAPRGVRSGVAPVFRRGALDVERLVENCEEKGRCGRS
ncbi:hypothetical protein ACWEQL_10575 [Kitasatospora sp. NPDC004240]